MNDGTDLAAIWAGLAAGAPEYTRRDLPKLEGIFYAGAAAVHDALMMEIVKDEDITTLDVQGTLKRLLARLTDVGEELREGKQTCQL